MAAMAGFGCQASSSGRSINVKGVAMQAVITIPFALLAHGTLIIIGFLVVGFFAFAYSWYTRRGSAINQHPYADLDHNSGRETPSELAHDITQDVRNWDRGVTGHHGHRHKSRTHPKSRASH
jgi:hypothetical protein